MGRSWVSKFRELASDCGTTTSLVKAMDGLYNIAMRLEYMAGEMIYAQKFSEVNGP